MTETHLLNVANCEGEHFVYLEAILKWSIDQCAGWSESVNRVRSDLENIHAIAEQGNYQTAEGLFAKAKSTRGIPGYNYSILRNSIDQWKSAIDTQVQTWNSTLKVIDHFIQNSSGIKELTLVYRTMARFKLEFQQVGEFLNYATSLEVSEFKNTCLSEGNRATSAMQARLARAKAKQTAGRVRFAVWLLFGALLIIGLILVIRWHIKETEI